MRKLILVFVACLWGVPSSYAHLCTGLVASILFAEENPSAEKLKLIENEIKNIKFYQKILDASDAQDADFVQSKQKQQLNVYSALKKLGIHLSERYENMEKRRLDLLAKLRGLEFEIESIEQIEILDGERIDRSQKEFLNHLLEYRENVNGFDRILYFQDLHPASSSVRELQARQGHVLGSSVDNLILDLLRILKFMGKNSTRFKKHSKAMLDNMAHQFNVLQSLKSIGSPAQRERDMEELVKLFLTLEPTR